MNPAEEGRLEANKRLAQRLMELLIDRATAQRARDLMTEDYIQHNPNLPDGRDAIIAFAATEAGRKAKETMQLGGPAQFIAQGDLVMMMQPILRPDPLDPGKTLHPVLV